jgi:hypothetical protein
MDEKELNALLGKVKTEAQEAVKGLISEATNGMISKDYLSTQLEALKVDNNAIKELTEAIDKQGLEIKRIEGAKQNAKSFDEMIMEKAADFARLAKGEARELSFELKTEVNRASVSSNYLGMQLPNIGQLPYSSVALASLFTSGSVSPNSGGIIRYTDQQAVTRSAGNISEGNTYPESAISWITKTLSVEKVGDSIPVTMEAMADINYIASEIRRLLEINMMLKEDSQLFSGTGATPQIKGVYTSAVEWNAGAYTGAKAVGATIYDLIAVLNSVIRKGKESKYMPNIALINPADALSMKLTKDKNENYVQPPFMTNGGIDGIRIVESNQVTEGTLLMGDFRYGTLYTMGDVKIEAGFIDKQWRDDLMTLKASKREALLIRDVDVDAFLKVTSLSDALTAITLGA